MFERRMRRVALTGLAVTTAAVGGVGMARWATNDANGFYMNPVDRGGVPAYARQQPIADSLWERQAAPGFHAAAVSTATSAQPSYRSASGS